MLGPAGPEEIALQINGLPPLLGQALLAALPKAAEGFRIATAGPEGPPQPTPSPMTLPATSVQMLVALAATEPNVERRRRQAVQADRGLSVLEQLHAELLVGAPSRERLNELVEWAESFETSDQPELASLARDVELRVRVEIAKFDQQV